MRAALAPGGSILIADERVAEKFEAPAGEIERMMYGWSITHCLPVSMAEQPSAAIGTAIRPATVLTLAKQAGFSSCEILPIENRLFRFFRLRDGVQSTSTDRFAVERKRPHSSGIPIP